MSGRHLFWIVPVAWFLAFKVGFSMATLVIFVVLIDHAVTIAIAAREGRFRAVHVVRWLHFFGEFAVDLAKSNFVLALDVLTIHTDLHEVYFILVPIDDLNEGEVVFLSHRITLTPGTLACGITEDKRHLVVHAMYDVDENTPMALRRPIDILKYGGQA